MRESEIREKLDGELSGITPPMGERLKNTPIMTEKRKAAERAAQVREVEKGMNTNKKIAITAIAACCVIALTLGLIFGLGGEPALAESFVVIDVNPSIELTVDGSGAVTSVTAGNADAQILLSGEAGIVGVSVEEAAQKIIALTIECGFLSEDDLSVSVTVSAADKKTREKIEKKVTEAVVAAAGELEAAVNTASSVFYQKQVDKLKAANPDNQAYQSLTPEKYRLAVRARACDRTLTLDAAVAADETELIGRVKAGEEYRRLKYVAALDLAQAAVLYAYEDAKQLAYDTAYYDVVMAGNSDLFNILKNLERTVNVTKYVAYSQVARSLTHAADLIRLYSENPVITEDDILNALNLFGVTEEQVDVFMADMAGIGAITKENILKYIGSLSADPVANEAKIDVAVNVYNGAESYVSVIANVDISNSYLNAAINAYNGLLAKAAEAFDSLVNSVLSLDFSRLANVDDLVRTAAELNSKAAEALGRLEFTEAERAQIAEKQQNRAASIKTVEDAYNSYLTQLQESLAEVKTNLAAGKRN